MTPRRRRLGAVSALALAAAVSGCDISVDFGQPSTRALENGAVASIGRGHGFAVTAAYADGSGVKKLDLEVAPSGALHVIASTNGPALEAVIVGDQAYFRGRAFLAQHFGNDPSSAALVNAAGDSWWRAPASLAPAFPDFTDPERLRSTFLGSAITARSDRIQEGGREAVQLEGPRARVLIETAEPHRLLRVQTRSGVTVDGILGADFRYSKQGQIAEPPVPAPVVDFSDLSTLPPIFTVESIDTSGCGSPCVLAAQVRNLGGRSAAPTPPTVAFKMADPATGRVYGTCVAAVPAGVGYNATVKVACTLSSLAAGDYNGAAVTATPA